MSGALDTAKAAAYSALLAFFPVLGSAAALLAQIQSDRVARFIARFLFQVVPPGTEALVRQAFSTRGERPVLILIAAAILALWAASGVFSSLVQGFNRMYDIPDPPGWLRSQVRAMILVLMTVVPVLAACFLVLFGGWIDSILVPLVTGGPGFEALKTGWRVLYRLLRLAIALGGMVSITAVLYYYGPNRRQAWRGVWPGAGVATVLWLISTAAFGWYLRNVSSYNVMYGSVAAGIALLVWMYLLAFSALVGCRFNVERELLELGAKREALLQ